MRLLIIIIAVLSLFFGCKDSSKEIINTTTNDKFIINGYILKENNGLTVVCELYNYPAKMVMTYDSDGDI